MRRLSIVLSLTLLSACAHEIEPLAVRSRSLQPSVAEPAPIRLFLILDAAYRGYESRDRGHWAADPQVYSIGPSLTHLTQQVFDLYFTVVGVGRSLEDAKGEEWGFFVQPRVDRFDNKLRFFAADQTLTLRLSATLRTSSLTPIGSRLSAEETATQPISVLATSDVQMNRHLTKVIERALHQLAEEAHREIDLHEAD